MANENLLDDWAECMIKNPFEHVKITTHNTPEDLHKPGVKDDKGKPPVGLVFESFPRALLAIADVAGMGAKKYTRGGWQTVENGDTRYTDAMGRHILNKYIDGHNDPESELPHLAHAAWNALAVLELYLRENTEHD